MTQLKEYSEDWTAEDSQDLLFGYKWDRLQDTLSPNIILTHGKRRVQKWGVRYRTQLMQKQ